MIIGLIRKVGDDAQLLRCGIGIYNLLRQWLRTVSDGWIRDVTLECPHSYSRRVAVSDVCFVARVLLRCSEPKIA
jgi:hypothetical protein